MNKQIREHLSKYYADKFFCSCSLLLCTQYTVQPLQKSSKSLAIPLHRDCDIFFFLFFPNRICEGGMKLNNKDCQII